MTFDSKLLSGLTVLIAVVEAGTIARAAEALGLSPSGVSRALSRLEQRVGARLLARTTRSLSLTDEGRRFYEQVGPHLAGIEEAAIAASGSTPFALTPSPQLLTSGSAAFFHSAVCSGVSL